MEIFATALIETTNLLAGFVLPSDAAHPEPSQCVAFSLMLRSCLKFPAEVSLRAIEIALSSIILGRVAILWHRREIVRTI